MDRDPPKTRLESKGKGKKKERQSLGSAKGARLRMEVTKKAK